MTGQNVGIAVAMDFLRTIAVRIPAAAWNQKTMWYVMFAWVSAAGSRKLNPILIKPYNADFSRATPKPDKATRHEASATKACYTNRSMNVTQIEKNIPIPDKRSQGKGKSIYPLAHMDIGDSFFLRQGNHNKAAVAIYHHRKKFPQKKFTARLVDDGVRVWRIE